MSDRTPDQNRPRYRVAAMGIETRDRRLIEIVFRHSRYNRNDFMLVDADANAVVDILLVNPYEIDGLRAMARARASSRPTPLVTIVPVGRRADGGLSIALEKLPLQLLPSLNQLVKQEFESPQPPPNVFRRRGEAAASPPGTRSLPTATTSGAASEAPPRGVDPANKAGALSADSGASARSPAPLPVSSRIAPQSTVPSVAHEPDSELGPASLIFPLSEFGESRFPATRFPPLLQAERVPPVSVRANPSSSPTLDTAKTSPDNLVTFPGDNENVVQPVAILVVDDSPTVRRQLNRAITRFGAHCVAVGDADAAMAELSQSHYELVMVDVVMPGRNGFQLTREIRRQHPGTPVVMLTNRSTPLDKARGALAGSASYLVKPVSQSRLEAVLIKQLRKALAIDDLTGILRTHPPKPAISGTDVRVPENAPSPDSSRPEAGLPGWARNTSVRAS